MQSPHPHWPSAPAVATMTGVPAATPAPITAHPDYSAYHQVFTSVFFDWLCPQTSDSTKYPIDKGKWVIFYFIFKLNHVASSIFEFVL